VKVGDSRSRRKPIVDLQLPLVNMSKEVECLRLAIAVRDPLLVLGPQGSGKTRIIQEALSANPQVLSVEWRPTLHALLVAMANAVLEIPEDRLKTQTSVHLKGIVWSALERSPVPIVLDDIVGASFPAYRFLQRVYHTPGVALFAASRDTRALGALARLYWNPQKVLSVPPLSERDAERLFESAADRFNLRHLCLEEFREKVLHSAGGNPGQIIEMCRLATQPQYLSGRYIKFAPLRIDTVTKFAR
jgi:hypothetical protein